MQKVTTCLWCDGNAREVADFYVSIFPDAKITGRSSYPSSSAEGLADFQQELAGKDLTINLTIGGSEFVLLNAGAEFKPNPSISFFVNFDPNSETYAGKRLDELWEKLCDGGEVLMPLDSYSFSTRYGWVQDKFGFSWQLILTNPEGEPRPTIVPCMLFSGDRANQAERALRYYTETFPDSQVGTISRYEQDVPPVRAGGIMYGDARIGSEWIAVMDAPGEHDFGFNEAISFIIHCNDQAEIDHYWSALSRVPESEQCGWCKDEFGVSWQVVYANIDQLLARPHGFKTLMEQKKIIIDEY